MTVAMVIMMAMAEAKVKGQSNGKGGRSLKVWKIVRVGQVDVNNDFSRSTNRKGKLHSRFTDVVYSQRFCYF